MHMYISIDSLSSPSGWFVLIQLRSLEMRQASFYSLVELASCFNIVKQTWRDK